MSAASRPLLALTVGDPAGIGPEIARAAMASKTIRAAMQMVVIGPKDLCPAGTEPIDSVEAVGRGARDGVPQWLATAERGPWELGRAQAECGRAALSSLRLGHELALAGKVEGLVTGPVCKEALHLAGELVEGQTELLARWCGVDNYEMVALAGELRVMLLTRHMPLRQALECIDGERIQARLQLFDQTLRNLGFAAPRLALAGLNPHAGENGILGDEEQQILEPALAALSAGGLHVSGPHSPDTIFLRAAQGEFDGVLALYHDQAFIPVKMSAPDSGLTLIAGLSYLRISPVHGTAFDIAGQGKASATNLMAALLEAARLVASRSVGSAS